MQAAEACFNLRDLFERTCLLAMLTDLDNSFNSFTPLQAQSQSHHSWQILLGKILLHSTQLWLACGLHDAQSLLECNVCGMYHQDSLGWRVTMLSTGPKGAPLLCS